MTQPNESQIKNLVADLAKRVIYDGTYVSLAALQAAVPTSATGHVAIVDSGSGSHATLYLWDVQDGWVLAGGSVTSVNTHTGVVVLTTDDINEGTTNKYFTVARVLAAILTGLTLSTATAITAADTILSALGKLQAQITALINDTTASGTTVYSSTKVNTLISTEATTRSTADALLAPLASPTFTGTPLLTTTPAANDNSKAIADTEYVDRAIAAQAKKTIIGSFQSIV